MRRASAFFVFLMMGSVCLPAVAVEIPATGADGSEQGEAAAQRETDEELPADPSAVPEMPEGILVSAGEGEAVAAAAAAVVPGDIALGIINKERVAAGLTPLLNAQRMYEAASMWSTYMSQNDSFVHMSRVYDYAYQASFAAKAGWQLGGDLIAWGYQSEEAVAQGWLNSTAHRAWLMDVHGRMEAAGVAQVGNYWTLYIAGNPSSSGTVDRTPTSGTATGPTMTLSLSVVGSAAPRGTVTMKTSVAGAGAEGVSEAFTWSMGGKTLKTGKTLDLTNAQAGKSIDATYKVTDLETQTTATRSVKVSISDLPVTRLAGQTRYSTNRAVNDAVGGAGRPVFIATGASFPDALSIGPAVVQEEGSLILTEPTKMSQGNLDSVVAKKPSKIYVVGGSGAVSDGVVAQLRGATGLVPERISGANRYETSVSVYNRFFKDKSLPMVFVATGRDYPDALTAAAAGGALGAPVLLVDGQTGTNLPDSVLSALSATTKSAVVIGGEGAVRTRISTNLAKSFSVTRLAGASRYETNTAVNDYIGTRTSEPVTRVWIATGKDFPDALSAAVPAGVGSQRLVLSNGSCVRKPVVSSWIKTSTSKVDGVTLVGGEGVLSASVKALTECH